MKFKNLLLTLALVGAIQSVAQTDSNCTVPLTCPEFDFYAKALVERNGLRSDTTLMAGQISSLGRIASQLSATHREDSLVIGAKDQIIGSYREAVEKSFKRVVKAEKRANRRGIFALVFATTTAMSIIVVLILAR